MKHQSREFITNNGRQFSAVLPTGTEQSNNLFYRVTVSRLERYNCKEGTILIETAFVLIYRFL